MTRINAIRSNAVRSNARSNATSNSNQAHSVTWGSISRGSISHSSARWGKNTGALIFAAVLIVCSLTVGCSSSNNNDKPKSLTSNNPTIPVPQAPVQLTPAPAPVMQAEAKPAQKKVVHKRPATVNYTDQTYGLTFEYPRRYAIETGSAASDLLAANPLAMNFVEPGGVALAAVELPETTYANTDFSSAFFDVSIHKSLTADQCTEFAVPQPKTVAPVASTESASIPAEKPAATSTASASEPTQSAPPQSALAQPSASTDQTSTAKSSTDSASNSKLMLGDLELRSTEAVSGEGTRQSDSKYFHVFQNGSCYEFALNVTTDASEDGLVKHVDRDRVFSRLEQILSTVKIDAVKNNPVTTSEVTTETPTPAATPAQ